MPERTTLTQVAGPVLVVGPAYAGKSELAARALYPDRPAIVLGTGELEDPAFVRRVERLKALRPPYWETVEPVRDLPAALDEALRRAPQVLVDSLSQWLAAQCVEGAPYGSDGELEARLEQQIGQLGAMIEMAKESRIVVVTAEAGAGPAPARGLERLYRRAIGDANRSLAALAQTVIEVNVGIARLLKSAAVR